MASATSRILLPALVAHAAFVGTVSAGVAETGSEWILVWSDEFDYTGAPDPEKWDYDLGGGGWGNSERQIYTDDLSNARVENGSLLIQAVQTVGDTRAPTYTSARLVTREKKSIQYGRVEVRAIIPSETGTWAAIWMLATDALRDEVFWPNNGEIDILERVGYQDDPLFLQLKGVDYLENLHSTLHTERQNFRNGGGTGGGIYLPEISSQFNVYAFEWFPDRMEFFVNGTSFFEVHREQNFGIPIRNRPDDISPWWPFDQRFHLIMNVAIGGNWGGHFNRELYPNSPYNIGIDDDGQWPQTMEVDYVRMYQHESLYEQPASIVPGMIDPVDYIAERGVVYENSTSQNAALNLTSLQPGDYVVYDIRAAEPGTYRIILEYAAGADNQVIRLTNLSTGAAITTDGITSSDAEWVMNQIGTLDLQRGPNRIRLEVESNDLRLGALQLDAPSNGTWKGFPLDMLKVADTGALLGPVGTTFSPWIFHPGSSNWIYPIEALGATIPVQSQWLWVQNPAALDLSDASSAPWYFSSQLNKWFYASQAGEPTGLTTPQWVYLFF